MTQRTWLITGVNSGFGRFMTEALLQQGTAWRALCENWTQ